MQTFCSQTPGTIAAIAFHRTRGAAKEAKEAPLDLCVRDTAHPQSNSVTVTSDGLTVPVKPRVGHFCGKQSNRNKNKNNSINLTSNSNNIKFIHP